MTVASRKILSPIIKLLLLLELNLHLLHSLITFLCKSLHKYLNCLKERCLITVCNLMFNTCIQREVLVNVPDLLFILLS